MAARKIKARLGSVRLVLSEAAECTRAYHSSLQGKVVEDMVKDCQLTAEEKADIASVVSSVGFMAKDEELLLASLSGVSSGKMARRKQQDFQSFIQYLAGDEWRALGACKNNMDDAIDICSNVMITRYGCINPNEFTLRRLASLAMCMSYHDAMLLSLGDKKSNLTMTKSRFFKRKRLFKQACETDPSRVLPYLEVLPNSPNDFEISVVPGSLGRYKIKDCWISPQVKLQDLYNLEVSFGCRSDCPTTAIAIPTMPHQNQMQQMFQMFQMLQNQNNGVNLTFQASKKRGLRELMEGDERSQADALQHRHCKTVEDFDGVSGSPEPKEPPKPSKAPEPKPAETGVVETGVVDDGVVGDASQSKQLAIKDMSGKGDVGELFGALMERDTEKKKARSDEAKAKKLQAAAEKALEKVEAKAATPSKKLKPNAATPSPKAAKPSKLKPKAATPSKLKRVGVDHEASRQQYLARSDKQGSKSFKYGKDVHGDWFPHKTEAAAMAAAKSWLSNPS